MRKFYLLVLLVVTALIYLPGLEGELIFDDRANLAPLYRWFTGTIGWQQLIFGNESGPLGRPLAMASFAANTFLSGDSVWGLKLGNLVLHLATGILLFLLLTKLSIRDRLLSRTGAWGALVVTAVWLLHPLLVSTVLYTVQRMAILSTLFVVAALLSYMKGRTDIEEGKSAAGSIWLFAAVPAFTVLAALSKENGLLAPLLCGVLEWVYFAPRSGNRRPWQARVFLLVGVGLPLAAGAIVLVLAPDIFLAGYANRPFGPVERLLTQGRVLFDYVGSILLPAGPKFSLLRDDYIISTGLLTPITTLFSWIGWAVIALLAIAWRKRLPGFTAGIAIFLVGHAMESSIFPLLIYFEHRNYLPSIGILWAAASLLVIVSHWAAARIDNPKLILAFGLGALLIVLAAATHSRARIWQSEETLTRQSLEHYPDSRHLRLAMQRIEMQKFFPDVAAAKSHAEYLLTFKRSSSHLLGLVSLILIDCQTRAEVEEELIERAFRISPDTIEADLFMAINILANVVTRKSCQRLAPFDLAEGITRIVNSSELPESTTMAWRLRAVAARLYYKGGNLASAYREARKAWEASPRDFPTGMMLIGLSINLGLFDDAKSLLDDIEPDIPAHDRQGRALASSYRKAIDQKFATEILENQPRYQEIFSTTDEP